MSLGGDLVVCDFENRVVYDLNCSRRRFTRSIGFQSKVDSEPLHDHFIQLAAADVRIEAQSSWYGVLLYCHGHTTQ